ncbi:MAG: response regulator [Magnetococcales bacterium]|nr:response regulator [Magnetococcales bacterium]MBF0323041.1 response regulator [Magnetococcales bacterium]
MRILIVDDQFNNRMLLEKILAKHGVCDFAVNGLEAVEMFQFAVEDGQPYQLVCMDIMMPLMDGQEALARIREIEKNSDQTGVSPAVVFMISALDTEEQVVKAFFRGKCDDYITKPITPAKMLEKLKEYGLAAS